MGMRSEKLLSAIGSIDDELILQAMTARSENTNHRRTRWIKYAAVAACLCLLLALPIVAARNEMLVDFFADMTGWHIRSKEYFADKDFSREVRSLSKKAAGESTNLPMENLEQVEEFLGIAIPKNPLLTAEIADKVHMEVETNGQSVRYDTPCLVYLAFSEDGSVVAADTHAAYRYKQMHLYVTYRMTTEYAVSIGGGGMGNQNADMAQLQTYITDSGRECAVFFEKSGDGIYSGRGYTVVDAVLIELSLIGRSEENIQQAITEVLEAFG